MQTDGQARRLVFAWVGSFALKTDLSTFLTEIFLTFGMKPLPVFFLFLFARDAP